MYTQVNKYSFLWSFIFLLLVFGGVGGWGWGECPNCRPQWGLGREMCDQTNVYGMVGIGTEIHIYLKTALFCSLDTYISIYFFVI